MSLRGAMQRERLVCVASASHATQRLTCDASGAHFGRCETFGVAKSTQNQRWVARVSLRGVMRRERLVCGVSASYAAFEPLMRRKRLSFGALRDVWSCEIHAKSALGRVSDTAGRDAA